MADTGVKRTTKGDILANMRKLLGRDVLVGIPSTEAGREGSPINNAAILYIMETGSPAANIPPRPTVGPGIRDARGKIDKAMESAARAAIRGDAAGVEAAMNRAGIEAVSAIQQRIRSNTPPPLAESTLAKRRRRGVTRTNTLVDTGQMLKAVTYVIEKKGKN